MEVGLDGLRLWGEGKGVGRGGWKRKGRVQSMIESMIVRESRGRRGQVAWVACMAEERFHTLSHHLCPPHPLALAQCTTP